MARPSLLRRPGRRRESVSFGADDLHGTLPMELLPPTSGRLRIASAPHLSGVLPTQLGALAYLGDLRISATNLSGTLPRCATRYHHAPHGYSSMQ